MALHTIVEHDTTHIKPYVDKVKQALSDEVTTRATLGAHQLLDPVLNTYITGGATVTNNNGVITVNGTQIAGENLAIKKRVPNDDYHIYLPKGSYTFSCEGVDTVYVGTTYNGSYSEFGQGASVTFTISDNTNSDYKLADGSVLVGLFIGLTAQTYNNKKLYPLLSLATDADTSYGEFTKTNRELTKDDSGLTANAFANGAVNLGNNTATSQTITTGGANLAFVVNSNKEVTVNGTTGTALITLKVIDEFTGLSKVKLSGCPSGGSATTFGLQIYDVTAGAYGNTDYGDGVVATLDPTHTYNAILYVRANQTISSKVFKPMITVADMPNSDYTHYVPYAMSNKELTDLSSLIECGVKNLSDGNETVYFTKTFKNAPKVFVTPIYLDKDATDVVVPRIYSISATQFKIVVKNSAGSYIGSQSTLCTSFMWMAVEN